ncbi:carboxymuconolactone decarboxylase family protein [Defluviimonas sp. SAOS-178_SWC]|uniref:carboxymuconolactone decarboxylase family protein n=1 Tax=Defluviimonas sp. SAOS-178_SWC TaxID=3121287 RepID=UPI0032217EF0
MTQDLPGGAGDIARDYPDVWTAYTNLGEATAKAGSLSARERRLVKLALAIGTGSEGAVHSHARRAEADGVSAADMEQVALLAIGPLGFPRAVAARSWITDVTEG